MLEMHIVFNRNLMCLWLLVELIVLLNCVRHHTIHQGTTQNLYTKKKETSTDQTLRARRKACFLRPDTGPCRADIVQWYFDVKQRKCYRFFWGGCQGNGNRFETARECNEYCFLNSTSRNDKVPHFCSLAFEYGTCFGHYNRWAWDNLYKSCKRRLYSGCGGNQNNFQSQKECVTTCINLPDDTTSAAYQHLQ